MRKCQPKSSTTWSAAPVKPVWMQLRPTSTRGENVPHRGIRASHGTQLPLLNLLGNRPLTESGPRLDAGRNSAGRFSSAKAVRLRLQRPARCTDPRRSARCPELGGDQAQILPLTGRSAKSRCRPKGTPWVRFESKQAHWPGKNACQHATPNDVPDSAATALSSWGAGGPQDMTDSRTGVSSKHNSDGPCFVAEGEEDGLTCHRAGG